MPRGYRSIILAALGWLILSAQTPSPERMSRPSPAPKNETSEAASAGEKIPMPFPITVVESPKQAVSSQRREDESREHDARDLDAQIRAADATENQVFPAWIAAILSGAGTALIVWTLLETRRSNAIAKRDYGRARIEARKALKAAEAANQITRGVQRPWVSAELNITEFSIIDQQIKMSYVVKFSNIGETIAQGVFTRTQAMFSDSRMEVNASEYFFHNRQPRKGMQFTDLMPSEYVQTWGFLGTSLDQVPWYPGSNPRVAYLIVCAAAYYRIAGEAYPTDFHMTERTFALSKEGGSVFQQLHVTEETILTLSPDTILQRYCAPRLTT